MAIHHPKGTPESDDPMSGQAMRKVMLEVVEEFNTRGSGNFQAGPILKEVAQRCGATSTEMQQAILTVWNDLFRSGLLAPGLNLDNPTFPFCHVTAQGRESLKQLSRDPANPDGYLNYVTSRSSLDDVSRSYLEESVHTFNASCFKAAAVMIGGAAEALVLRLRDKIVLQLTGSGASVPTGMNDWRIKTVRDAITTHLDRQRGSMPRELRETYDAYWSAFAEQIRRVRNDAGHPKSVDPVTPESIHASLLIFPELAHLISELETWIGP